MGLDCVRQGSSTCWEQVGDKSCWEQVLIIGYQTSGTSVGVRSVLELRTNSCTSRFAL